MDKKKKQTQDKAGCGQGRGLRVATCRGPVGINKDTPCCGRLGTASRQNVGIGHATPCLKINVE